MYCRNGGATEAVREVPEVVTAFLPEQGMVELERHGEQVRLRLTRGELLGLQRRARARAEGDSGRKRGGGSCKPTSSGGAKRASGLGVHQ